MFVVLIVPFSVKFIPICAEKYNTMDNLPIHRNESRGVLGSRVIVCDGSMVEHASDVQLYQLTLLSSKHLEYRLLSVITSRYMLIDIV